MELKYLQFIAICDFCENILFITLEDNKNLECKTGWFTPSSQTCITSMPSNVNKTTCDTKETVTVLSSMPYTMCLITVCTRVT